MNKTDALESIKEIWNNESASLGEKILKISTEFYASGLDVESTAAYVHTTESELAALLSLGEFDDELIGLISKVNPPKTTWTILSCASEEEARHALVEYSKYQQEKGEPVADDADKYFYQSMIGISGPTIEQKVSGLSASAIKHALKKGEDFNALNDKEVRFLKSISAQKKIGKVLSEKQINWLIAIFNKIITKGAIARNSIDGDQEICDKILDAMEK
ncbi:MAG: hypothetical protein J6Y14_04545 [Fibrobacter sp.]|nr:hypothetical protein [Fibrobacter sp.]